MSALSTNSKLARYKLERLSNLNILPHLLDLINELLDFIKAEMKHIKLSFAEVNVSDVLEETVLNAKIEGLESGADAHITKPFSMDYLLVQIYNLIENRKNIIDHFAN